MFMLSIKLGFIIHIVTVNDAVADITTVFTKRLKLPLGLLRTFLRLKCFFAAIHQHYK